MVINQTIDTGESASPVTSGSVLTTAKEMELLWRSFGDGASPSGQQRYAVSFDNVVRAYNLVVFSGATGSLIVRVNNQSHFVSWPVTIDDPSAAAAMASVINASTGSLTAGIVTAQALSSSLFINAVEAGKTANSVPIVVTGTGLSVGSALMQSGSAGAADPQYF